MSGENCKAAYELCRDRNPQSKIYVDAKPLLKQKKIHLKK
jgi:hypothetical protein